MGQGAISIGPAFAVALVVLVMVAAAAAAIGRLGMSRAMATASLRVTLPGAFVGVLLGGGTAVQAGATQVLVLVALLAVEAIAVAVTVELVAGEVLRAREPAG
jgi:putative ABC transport system permease protein